MWQWKMALLPWENRMGRGQRTNNRWQRTNIATTRPIRWEEKIFIKFIDVSDYCWNYSQHWNISVVSYLQLVPQSCRILWPRTYSWRRRYTLLVWLLVLLSSKYCAQLGLASDPAPAPDSAPAPRCLPAPPCAAWLCLSAHCNYMYEKRLTCLGYMFYKRKHQVVLFFWLSFVYPLVWWFQNHRAVCLFKNRLVFC